MEVERQQHEQYVDAWLAERESPKTARHMAELLIAALDALGAHGRSVLGGVTLEAICGRILSNAQIMHPCLNVFRTQVSTVTNAQLALEASDVEELHAATRDVLVDLLHVLSHLTGGVLNARLHEKLGAVGASGGGAPRSPRPRKGG